MNPLHEQLLALFGNDPQLAQDLQNALAYPLPKRRKMAELHGKRLYPKGPEGKAYASKTFWRKLADSRLFHTAFCGSPEKQRLIAKFLEEERRWTSQRNAARGLLGDARREVWPPPAVFCKHTSLPMPDERRGW